MKIAIEAQRIFRINKHGMDFVALETIREIQTLDKKNEYYIFVAPGDDKCLEESENMKIIELRAFGGYPIWEQVALPLAINKIDPDIVHCTSNTAPLFLKQKLIVTLHDIIFLEKKAQKNKSLYQNLGRLYRRLIVPKIISKASKVITVSEFECTRIKDFLNLKEDKISYIHNGYNKHFTKKDNPKDIYKKYIDQDNYIFFLGNTDPKKNTDLTLCAYAKYIEKSNNKNISCLLIADLKESTIDELLKINNIEWIKPFIYYPGYIPNVDLPYIYSGAKLFLYPSLRESFGIPILEAMACGTPIITSNTSAIPEIAGSGAILVDPKNIDILSDKIFLLLNNQESREKQIEYGLGRVKLFSWGKTASELIRLYENI